MHKTSLITIAALAFASMSSSVVAAEAISASNVRSGPGTSHGILDQLFAGEEVTVDRCVAVGWCYITHPGPDGWVSAKLLADNGNDDDFFNDRNVSSRVSVSFGFGGDFDDDDDDFGRRNRRDLVCLVTFFDRDDVEAGADADVQRARVLPRRVAEMRDGPNDRQDIFDYGSNRETIRTCNYLDRLN